MANGQIYKVSIHALLAERDTFNGQIMGSGEASFNSRAPRGARPFIYWRQYQGWRVSIHALLAERDSGTFETGISPLSRSVPAKFVASSISL